MVASITTVDAIMQNQQSKYVCPANSYGKARTRVRLHNLRLLGHGRRFHLVVIAATTLLKQCAELPCFGFALCRLWSLIAHETCDAVHSSCLHLSQRFSEGIHLHFRQPCIASCSGACVTPSPVERSYKRTNGQSYTVASFHAYSLACGTSCTHVTRHYSRDHHAKLDPRSCRPSHTKKLQPRGR